MAKLKAVRAGVEISGLVHTRALSELLGLPLKTVEKLITNHNLPCLMVSGKWMHDVRSVFEWESNAGSPGGSKMISARVSSEGI